MAQDSTSVASRYATENAKYGHPTDFYGTSRQNLRHYLTREVLGYNIHPKLPAPAKGTKVAEVATGTGLWLCEVAQQYPDAICEGSDIQLDQAPPAAWLPNNVTMRTWSLFNPPPAEMEGRYDIVHARTISILVKDGDPTPIINNLKRLLKPGGWLQWGEINSLAAFVAKVDEGMETPFMEQWAAWMQGKRAEDAKGREWQLKVPDYLSSNGFQNVTMDNHTSKMTDNMVLARAFTNELLQLTDQSVYKVHGESEEGRRMHDIVMHAARESREGAALILPLITFLAQKT